jgi:tetratricopeptide (TPR) repeat protein
MACFQKAIDLDPKFAVAYVNLGYIQQARSSIESAIRYYKKALEIDPNAYMAHNNLGFCHMIMTNFSEAISHLKKSYDYLPTLLTAINLGNAYRYFGDFSMALKWHRHALDVINNPEMKDYEKKYYFGSNWIYNYMPLKRGDIDTIRYYIFVKTIDEKRAFLNFALSFDYALLENFPLANKEFEKALDLQQSDRYRFFFVNMILYIQKFLRLNERINHWFEEKRKKLLTFDL